MLALASYWTLILVIGLAAIGIVVYRKLGPGD
jgi:hypothetical protein